MKSILYILLLCSLLVSACEDVIELDTPEGNKRLVVDGLLTDQQELQTVLLTYTAPYFSGQQTPAATDALVIIKENGTNADTLQETSPGIYQKLFQGRQGKEYSLYIKTAEGDEYLSSPQQFQAVPAIDSIYAEYTENSFSDESGYMVMLRTSDPKEEVNYYRWRLFINDKLQQGTVNLYIANDQLINGSNGLGLGFYRHRLQVGDNARVEQLSVSREAYDFMSLLNDQASGGAQFSTPPAPVRGNVVSLAENENHALGFFMASAVSSEKITITPAE
jgi:hypothetical protein